MRVAGDDELRRAYIKITESESSDVVMFSGDFENATDNLEHQVVYDMVMRFLDCLGCSSPYLRKAFKILLSPRLVVD